MVLDQTSSVFSQTHTDGSVGAQSHLCVNKLGGLWKPHAVNGDADADAVCVNVRRVTLNQRKRTHRLTLLDDKSCQKIACRSRCNSAVRARALVARASPHEEARR